MRKLLILSTLLFSSSLWAADRTNSSWRISIMAAEVSTESHRAFAGYEPAGNDTRAGVALGLAYAPAPQWDVELTGASQTYVSPYTRLFYMPVEGQPGMLVPVTEFHEYRVYPVDLSATRHFLADQPIAPYLRAGVRYVDAPGRPAQQAQGVIQPGQPIAVTEGYGFSDRFSTQAGAGVRVRITQNLAFRAEVNRLLRSEKIDFDPLTRFAAGVSWAF